MSAAAALLAVAVTWPSPGPALSVVLLVLGLPVCAIIVRWSLASPHVTVRGARVVTTDDEREWLVVRRPLGVVLLDGSRFGPPGTQRALANRVVAVHLTGRAQRVEILRLLDRIVALDRLERVSEGLGAHGRSSFTPEQRTRLSRHLRAALIRDIELLESRRVGRASRDLHLATSAALP